MNSIISLLLGVVIGWFSGVTIFVWLCNSNPSILKMFVVDTAGQDIVKNWFGKK